MYPLPVVPKLFECDLNLNLVNILPPTPQTVCYDFKKVMIVWKIFGSNLLSSFSMSANNSFDITFNL